MWTDGWLDPIGPLIQVATVPSVEHFLHITVAEVANQGLWTMEYLSSVLPVDAVEKILSIHPPVDNGHGDRFFWKLSNSGKFTLAL